jgi:hypothetical protein
MIEITTTSTQAGFAMPTYWTATTPAAAVRTLPTVGGVSAAAGTTRDGAGVARVRTFALIVDARVLADAFPGTSAWSPPT